MLEEEIEERCWRKRLRRGAGERYQEAVPEKEIEKRCRRKISRSNAGGRD